MVTMTNTIEDWFKEQLEDKKLFPENVIELLHSKTDMFGTYWNTDSDQLILGIIMEDIIQLTCVASNNIPLLTKQYEFIKKSGAIPQFKLKGT